MPITNPPENFAIVDSSEWEFVAIEPSGADAKQWLTVPGGGKALFKPNRPRESGEQGEDSMLDA
ncbi:hypothetical protein [Tomitella fengzijianii]|uniref:Uncharacterized protein n=1 Tax=Tomitella fengzijianii TaxID=2597660 RepID=A0A516X398_9ACTN|nr:hypothetical protein [Tomitella fengzijianii]QDQ97527.1 hypothetical protein FO059_09540 [Tomitella fengzijianii]